MYAAKSEWKTTYIASQKKALQRILCAGALSRLSFLDLFGPIAGLTNPITWHFYGTLGPLALNDTNKKLWCQRKFIVEFPLSLIGLPMPSYWRVSALKEQELEKKNLRICIRTKFQSSEATQEIFEG